MQILDGTAIVRMVRPTEARHFQEYATRHFMPYVESSVFSFTYLMVHNEAIVRYT